MELYGLRIQPTPENSLPSTEKCLAEIADYVRNAAVITVRFQKNTENILTMHAKNGKKE